MLLLRSMKALFFFPLLLAAELVSTDFLRLLGVSASCEVVEQGQVSSWDGAAARCRKAPGAISAAVLCLAALVFHGYFCLLLRLS